MRFQIIASALVLISPVVGFSDASPWILLSTSPLESTLSNQIQTASQVLDQTRDFLASCPTDRYLLVNQPGVTAIDLRRQSAGACAMQSLCSAADDMRIKGKFVVAEVVGKIKDMSKIQDTYLATYIKEACASKNKEVVIDQLNLPSLPAYDWTSGVARSDVILQERITATTADNSYTILFLSTPVEPYYEADFQETAQMDLRRHLQGSSMPRKSNETDWKHLSLFEKYQFFTPGIFMGIITAVVLLSILGIGLRALSSLEVSYGAFEKDMGPAPQKKQQ